MDLAKYCVGAVKTVSVAVWSSESLTWSLDGLGGGGKSA